MTKENMFKLLKLSDREFRSFYKDMIDNNILYLDEDNIYINDSMLGKGKLRNTLIAKFSEEEKYIT
jgi:hypothetical protein